jgi:hypothetical protein
MANYIFGEKQFSSLKKAMGHAQTILNKGNLGDTVEKEDFEFLLDALKKNGQEGIRKIGVGVTKITIETNDWGKRGFYLRRKDNSSTDFSFTKVFMGPKAKKNAKKRDFIEACRTAILPDKPYKSEHSEYHHIKPFNEIVEEFIKIKNIDIRKIECSGHGDNQEKRKFLDSKIESEFRAFHNLIAEAEILPEKEHRKIHSRF